MDYQDTIAYIIQEATKRGEYEPDVNMIKLRIWETWQAIDQDIRLSSVSDYKTRKAIKALIAADTIRNVSRTERGARYEWITAEYREGRAHNLAIRERCDAIAEKLEARGVKVDTRGYGNILISADDLARLLNL